jgi:two-component system, LuxR family, response regulator FixJ
MTANIHSARESTPLEQRNVRPIEQVAGLAAKRWSLTPRETQVLMGLLEGKDNKLLADALGCTRRTIESHLTSTFAKAGTQSRLELVSLCWLAWLDEPT